MGRKSGRKKSAQERAIARMRQSPGQYVASPGRSTESMMRAAAIHETGHAVAALALNMEVNFVILYAGADGIAGYCETAFGRPGATQEQILAEYNGPEMLRARLIQEIAGPAAEWIGQKWIGHANENIAGADVDRGAEDDDRKAVALAVQAVGREAWKAYLDAGSEAAHEIVRAHWAACGAIAQYLIDHPNKQMPGALVAQIVNETKGGA